MASRPPPTRGSIAPHHANVGLSPRLSGQDQFSLGGPVSLSVRDDEVAPHLRGDLVLTAEVVVHGDGVLDEAVCLGQQFVSRPHAFEEPDRLVVREVLDELEILWHVGDDRLRGLVLAQLL